MASDIFHISNGNQNILQNNRSTTHENELVSEYKSCIPQIRATIAVAISKFCFGTFAAFGTVMIAELYDGKAGITMSLHELTWYSSYLFMEPVGSILVSVLIERVGNRSAILISMFLYIMIWLMYYKATSAAMLLVTAGLTGLLYLIPLAAASTYIAEMSQPHLRSKLMTFSQLFAPCGRIFTSALSNFVAWRTIALLSLSFPVIAFLAVYFIPENPEWLSRKGRLVEMEISLAWLRGSKSPNPRETHNAVNSSPKQQENNINESMGNDGIKTVRKLYSQRSFYLPLMVIFSMFFIYNFSGMVAVTTFSIVIFEMIGSPIDEYMTTTALYVIAIVAQLICFSVINYTGKKKLIMFSTISVGLSFFIFSVLSFSNVKQFHYGSTILVIVILVGSFFGSMGFESVIYMLYIELFPRECRNMGVGIVLMFNCILTAIVDKIFLHVVDLITLQGVFLAFAFINLIGFVLFYFIVPNTNGRTLKEIEEHYATVRSLRHFSKIKKRKVSVNTESNDNNLSGMNLHHI